MVKDKVSLYTKAIKTKYADSNNSGPSVEQHKQCSTFDIKISKDCHYKELGVELRHNAKEGGNKIRCPLVEGQQ